MICLCVFCCEFFHSSWKVQSWLDIVSPWFVVFVADHPWKMDSMDWVMLGFTSQHFHVAVMIMDYGLMMDWWWIDYGLIMDWLWIDDGFPWFLQIPSFIITAPVASKIASGWSCPPELRGNALLWKPWKKSWTTGPAEQLPSSCQGPFGTSGGSRWPRKSTNINWDDFRYWKRWNFVFLDWCDDLLTWDWIGHLEALRMSHLGSCFGGSRKTSPALGRWRNSLKRLKLLQDAKRTPNLQWCPDTGPAAPPIYNSQVCTVYPVHIPFISFTTLIHFGCLESRNLPINSINVSIQSISNGDFCPLCWSPRSMSVKGLFRVNRPCSVAMEREAGSRAPVESTLGSCQLSANPGGT